MDVNQVRFSVSLSSSVDGNSEMVLDVPIEHRIVDSAQFKRRGFARLFLSRTTGVSGQFVSEYLTDEDQTSLLLAAKQNQLYYLRAPRDIDSDQMDEENTVLGYTFACSLVKSNLNDVVSLAVDVNARKVMSITVHPYALAPGGASACSDVDTGVMATEFNTTVYIREVTDLSSPDTQGYLQKLEREKLEKERGEHGDNRSFFSKYWMYLLPFVVFMLITSAMNPEARQGGR